MPKAHDKEATAENLEENGAVWNRDMAGNAARVAVERCGKQLTDKFDRAEDVLDYFDLRKARVVDPQSKTSDKEKFAYPVKQNSVRRAVVRERSARYRKKTG
jgi:hypothetical protein